MLQYHCLNACQVRNSDDGDVAHFVETNLDRDPGLEVRDAAGKPGHRNVLNHEVLAREEVGYSSRFVLVIPAVGRADADASFNHIFFFL